MYKWPIKFRLSTIFIFCYLRPLTQRSVWSALSTDSEIWEVLATSISPGWFLLSCKTQHSLASLGQQLGLNLPWWHLALHGNYTCWFFSSSFSLPQHTQTLSHNLVVNSLRVGTRSSLPWCLPYHTVVTWKKFITRECEEGVGVHSGSQALVKNKIELLWSDTWNMSWGGGLGRKREDRKFGFRHRVWSVRRQWWRRTSSS